MEWTAYLGTKTINPLDRIFTILASVSVGLQQKDMHVKSWKTMLNRISEAHQTYRFLKYITVWSSTEARPAIWAFRWR